MEAFKKEHHIGPNTKVFLILGRIAKEKSMDVSLRGIAAYHNKHPNVDIKVLMVGDGPAREELTLLAEELHISNIVDFIGQVSGLEVPFYYNMADIYTSASITETQGLTFMEAMAAGNIVLARFDTNLTGTIVNGKTGFFFTDENSFIAQVEKIFALTPEQKQNIINEAYQTVDIQARLEQAVDADLRDDGVEHHGNRGRNDHADGPRRRDEGRRGIHMVAAGPELGDQGPADRCGGGRTGAGDGCKEHPRQHRHHGKAAPDHPQNGLAELHQEPRDFAL